MSGNKSNTPPVMTLYKSHHLKESKTFCMAPWIHIHTTPAGIAAPCCISDSVNNDTGVADSKVSSLMEIVNSEKMNKLRADMLTGVPNVECTKCYQHEKGQVLSSRNMMNNDYGSFYEEAVVKNTQGDGSLKEFKMRYFDVRFSNICNFKCRTCGSVYSSQWEQEDLKSNVSYARIIPKNDNKQFLDEVIEQVPNMKVAYFAGGEPLITEEHYVLLEEMIRKKHTGVKLRYNTNMSNLKFKNKDLLALWEKFDHPIEIYASVDHYGKRAEYIRHGTNWAQVETNLLLAKSKPYINLVMNTVLSAFNFTTIGDFYEYIYNKGLLKPTDAIYTLYNMSTPEHYNCHILPLEYKEIGRKSLEKAIALLKSRAFSQGQLSQLENALTWALLYDTWEEHRFAFRAEVYRLDKLRGENFKDTFPEMATMLDFDRRPRA